jgi:hypothetical protein
MGSTRQRRSDAGMPAIADCENADPAYAKPRKKTQKRHRTNFAESGIRIMVSVAMKGALERSTVVELFKMDPQQPEQKRNESQ